MASENVTLENQLHSAQKNLLFLQQDHASTLKGLHAEIHRLQQHCTDLTYELVVRSSDPNDSGEARCRELQRRCEELEAQLKVKEQENAELMRDLEQKNAMISVLENTIREREKKYLDELKLKSHRLAVLSGELEQRASTIAYLTSQLHATKKRLLAGGSSGASPAVSPIGSFKPAPPPDPPTNASDGRQPDTPRRRMRKSLSQPLHSEYTELYRLGAAEGRRVVLRDAVDAMPDPTPFLQAREPPPNSSAEAQPLLRERPPVIPPIAPQTSPSAPSSPAHLPASPSPRSSPVRDGRNRGSAHIGVAHRIHRSPSAGGGAARAQPEVETLAVDQVSGEKVVRKRSGTDRTV
ncbi:coiled-coil domain-containing protein 92 [Colossoma macropomum]|uniref:coiled-coil domain-containing protein 92 n=1 Tax=Colossoma macropomum TaxID=42526 RepID=UPI001865528C|nr:coiled-coil domain-containing protein 92 [Colossoma macropomum]XP_036434164.1 coiled-coil domain-containing protein 92 [Colossoma macropomum]